MKHHVPILAALLLPLTALAGPRPEGDDHAPGRWSADEEAALHMARGADTSLPVWRESFGLQRDGERFLGGGPDYKVEFDAGGFVLTPALGADAPRNLSLGFRLESIRRGDVELLRAESDVPPERAGNTVLYRRGPGVTERYDVLREGVEQSFELASLPPGSGDLVVRGRLDVDPLLEPSAADGGGVAFTRAGLGGVRIGAVTGVDAAGRTAAGSLRRDGDRLELVLPGAFVAEAAFPLVLDPLVGAVLSPSGSTWDDADPDVAYAADDGVYLVAWERRFSGLDVDIRCQRVSDTGDLVGSAVVLEGDIVYIGLNPTVAFCAQSGRFLVAWQEAMSIVGPYDIVAKKVDATTGAATPGASIAGDTDNEIDPDAGGEATTADNEVLVVWKVVNGGIEGAQVNVAANTSAPYVVNSFTLSTLTENSMPAISKSGGDQGVYLVVWQRFFATPPPGDHDILARAVNRNGALLTDATLIGSTLGPDEEDPDVDGDGSRFYVAFEREASPGSGDNDVFCQVVDRDGTELTLGPEFEVEGDANDDEVDPAVAWCGAKVLVAWSDEYSLFDFDVLARGLSPVDCHHCGPELVVSSGSGHFGVPELASQRSGGGEDLDGALAVWSAHALAPPFEADVRGHLLEAVGTGGAVTLLDGGCGNGGSIAVSGPVAIANPDFSVSVSGADPLATVGILNVTTTSDPFLCPGSTCQFLPFAYTALASVSGGNAEVALPLPCMPNAVGNTFYFQWTLGPTSVSPCSLGPNLSLSDHLRVTMGT